MAELSLTCPSTTAAAAAGGGIDAKRRVLTRTGGMFSADTVLDVTAPGAGWSVTGESITWSGAAEFTDDTQVYLNGQHLFTAPGAGVDNDVYFVAASGSVAFESNLKTNDIIQFWKFQTTSSG